MGGTYEMTEQTIDFTYDDVEVIRRVGPAGGCPEIKISGPDVNVTAALHAQNIW